MKLNDDGVPELDIETDASDIRLTGMMASGIQPEQYSFRAYAAILYIDPRMKIFIQGQKVHAKYLVHSLYRPRKYIYIAKGFKVRPLREVKDTECAVKIAKRIYHSSAIRELTSIHDASATSKPQPNAWPSIGFAELPFIGQFDITLHLGKASYVPKSYYLSCSTNLIVGKQNEPAQMVSLLLLLFLGLLLKLLLQDLPSH
eukprot:g44246.t1